jgi:hypothetical protein
LAAENLIFFARSEINGGYETIFGVNYMLESGNAKLFGGESRKNGKKTR